MPEAKPALLIVEDDVDIADMLNAYFRVQGYEVSAVNWGEEAVKACTNNSPDLIILDIRLPDIDGYEVARRLRSIRHTENTPIIFLTEKREREDRLQGLEIGGDDYITKPFDIQELRLRVRNALKRSAPDVGMNPVTGLSEGALVDERLSECLSGEEWALLLVGLENLEHFRERYGFVASDDVQRAVSLIIHNASRDTGDNQDFLGQIHSTDFLLVTTQKVLPSLVERIRSRLRQSLEYFYPLEGSEQTTSDGKRLLIRISQLLPGDGPFMDIETIKAELFHRRYNSAEVL